ncbi:MAG: family 16 glycoside hydrolase [Bacteroidota bacterium]
MSNVRARIFMGFFICTSLFFIVWGCSTTAKKTSITRGQDNWAFRSVLDLQPRVLTLALHEDLWVAYDAETGGIVKAWQDGVDLDGPVYTQKHGPQPTSIGPAYFISPIAQPWLIEQEGETYAPETQFRGHKFENGHVVLMTELILKDGHVIEVEESPEYVQHEKGYTGLMRKITTNHVPAGTHVKVKTHLHSLTMGAGIASDEGFTILEREGIAFPGRQVIRIEGEWKLPDNGTSSLTAWFDDQPVIEPKAEAGAEEEIPAGLALINESDCQTCHNPRERTVGPSYLAIAEKYTTSPSVINTLAKKVISGGSGSFEGFAGPMTAHPDLPIELAEQMVAYILTLDGEEPSEMAAVDLRPSFSLTDTATDGQGLVMNVYYSGETVTGFREASDVMPPIYSGTVKGLDAYKDEDLGKWNRQVQFTFKGYLEVPTANNYLFRLTSDDGSRMRIDGKELVDNGGFHGFEGKEAETYLTAGKHALEVEFFQGGGGAGIRLEWANAAGEFEVIPPTAFSYDKEDIRPVQAFIPKYKLVRSIPGDIFPLQEVHPSFSMSQARPDHFEPMVGGLDFLDEDRMVVSTWDPEGSVYLLSGLSHDDADRIIVKRIARGLAEPLGLKVVNGGIYVLQKQELTQLIDHDGDMIIDEYRTLCNSWDVSANFHEFAFGLAYQDGYFYATLATAINPGGASTQPQIQDRGKAVRISRKDGNLEFVATGLRTPNGIGLGVDRQLFIADNQGDWLPSSKIVHLQQDAWYGSRSVDFEGTARLTETQPVVWLPQDEIGNSPSQPAPLNIGPYKGQMIHGEVTHGGIKRVFVEKVDDQYQGCLFRFSQGLEAGVNRLIWGPDGSLYIGGIGNPGNWAHYGKKWFGLQKMTYNGNSTFEMLAVRAKNDGMEIEFTEPVPAHHALNPDSWAVSQWRYVPTENYGGPKVDERQLGIRDIQLSQDRKKVFLQLSGMRAKHLVYIRIMAPMVSDLNHELWTREAWYTLNRIPAERGGLDNQFAINLPGNNSLTDNEVAAGWTLLFDGKSTDGWRNFRRDDMGSAWQVRNGELSLMSKTERGDRYGGDIITEQEYENFELSLEWKISEKGNSGIMFLVQESDAYKSAWQTGPEMQILDNVGHPDGRIESHRAGDLYDLIESKFVAVNPPNEWNHARIVLQDGHLEQWLNGYKVVETTLWDDAWKEMVAGSKFKDMPGFGTYQKGHISLQDHSDRVSFRNIKIRKLGSKVQ